MSEQIDNRELHQVLARAAEPVPLPDLARGALAEADRVRVRRRGIAAAGVAAAVVGAVVVSSTIGGRTAGGPVPAPRPDDGPAPTVEGEAVPDSVVQDFWDVGGVGSLPLRDSALPEVIEPPRSAPGLAENPMPAAVLSMWGEGDITYLRSPDGEWRSVPHPGPEPSMAELSDDGGRLALPGADGLEVWDVAGGTSTTLAWPADATLPVADLVVALRWAPDSEHVLVIGPRRSWLMGLDGSVEERPYPSNRYSSDLYFAEDGRVVELAAVLGGAGRELVEWEGSERVSTLDATGLSSLDRAAVRGDLVAAVRGVGGYYTPREAADWDGLIAFGRRDATARAYLPIRDDNAAYSDNGRLTVRGWLDDETVLAWVLPEAGDRTDGDHWWLVAWHYPSGELTRLGGGGAYDRLSDVVPALVG